MVHGVKNHVGFVHIGLKSSAKSLEVNEMKLISKFGKSKQLMGAISTVEGMEVGTYYTKI